MLKQNHIWIVLIAIVWVLNSFVADQMDPYFFSILIFSGINIILAVSLNLVNGFTGQFSIGHAGFMSVGAYASALLSITAQSHDLFFFSEPLYQNLFFLALLLVGGGSAAIIGYIVGLPSLRLKGDYLAIVTLGFGEIIRVILLNRDAVGGARGLPNIPALSSFGWVYTLVILVIFTMERLITSAQGRGFLAVREDEIAAEAMGVDTTRVKIRAFVISAFFAGTAGALFAHFLRYINPQSFDFNRSFEIVIMVVLGGMGSITGSVVAAIMLTILREALRPLQEYTLIDFRMVIYSLVLIIVMLTRPKGIFGTRELKDFFKK